MFGRLGDWTATHVGNAMYGLGFFAQVLGETFRFPFVARKDSRRVLRMQILFTGIEALPIIGLLGLALGVAMIVVGLGLLPQFGQGELLYPTIVTVVMRELGPILTALVIIARSSSAIATELGTMVVSNEVDAFVAIGINPIRYLVVPRVLGVTISSVALGIYFSAAGLLASFFVVQLFQPLPFAEYGLGLMAAITPSAIVTALVKQLAFGVIIGVTATLHGLLVGQSSTEIPRRVISAVGQSLFLTIAVNVLITVASYAFE